MRHKTNKNSLISMTFSAIYKQITNIELPAWIFSLVCVVIYIAGLVAKWYVIDMQPIGKKGILAALLFGIVATLPIAFVVTKLWHGIDKIDDKQADEATNATETIDQNDNSVGKVCDSKSKNAGKTRSFAKHARTTLSKSNKAYCKADRTSKVCWRTGFRPVVKVAMLIFVFWIPYIVMRFPGNSDPDTFWQISQVYGYLPLTDHHPVFDTVVFGAFWKLGDVFGSNTISLFVYCILQMVLTALAFGYSIAYCANRGVAPIVRKLMCAFYALYPFVVLSAQTMNKDSLYSWIFVFAFVLFAEVVMTKGRVFSDIRFVVVFVAISFLCMLTKKTGVYVFLISMLVVFFFSENKLRIALCTLVPVFVFVVLYSHALLGALNIEKGEQREMFSVSSQQVGLLMRDVGENFDENDWEILRNVYEKAETLGQVYDPHRADATKNLWKEGASSSDKLAFWNWYLRQYLEHPKQMFLAWIALDYPLLCVDDEVVGNESLLVMYDNVPSRTDENPSVEASLTFFGFNISGTQLHEFVSSCYRPSFISNLAGIFDALYLHITQAFAVLFSKVLFATWIPLFVAFYLFRRCRVGCEAGCNRHNRRGYSADLRKVYSGKHCLLLVVPVLLSSAAIAIGPVVLPRYMITLVYVAPFLLASIFFRPERCQQ